MIFAARRATTVRPRRMRPPPCSGAPGEAWKQRAYLLQQGFWPVGDPGIGVGWGVGGSGRSSKWCSGQGGPRGVADGSAVLRASVASRVCVDHVCGASAWSCTVEENAQENAMEIREPVRDSTAVRVVTHVTRVGYHTH